jgi:hypothetical protein
VTKGSETMSTKSDFTPAEWHLLVQAPGMAGMAVVTVAPSGPIGLFRELSAMGRIILSAGDSAPAGTLVSNLVADIRAIAEGKVAAPPEEKIPPGALRERLLDACRAVVVLLATRVPADEAGAYKQWIVDITTQVAQAAKEGTLLGFGGTPVIPVERTLLHDIAHALGVTAPAA